MSAADVRQRLAGLPWKGVLSGLVVGWGAVQLMPDNEALSAPVAVGFALLTILAFCLFVLFVANSVRIDEAHERLAALEGRDAAVWQYLGIEEEAEEEANPVEPGDAELVTWVVEPDDAPTEEFPAVEPEPATEPMRLGDEIEADFRAHQVHAEQAQTVRRQMVEKTEHGMTFRVMEDVQ